MGPVNWIAVILAASAAVALGVAWHSPVFRAGPARMRPARSYAPLVPVMLLGAAMLGHAYARIGAETLAAKPWLYFMQSGGIALAFIAPAVWITHARAAVAVRERLIDCAYWIAAYLLMGLVFWALG